jgi:hypothetical protein
LASRPATEHPGAQFRALPCLTWVCLGSKPYLTVNLHTLFKFATDDIRLKRLPSNWKNKTKLGLIDVSIF